VGDEGERGLDQEKACGKEKEEAEDEVHQGLPAGGHAGVQDVHPDVVALQVGVPCRHQEEHGEQMPFQLVNEHEAGVEEITQEHIGSGDDHHEGRNPGGGTADAIIDPVDPPDQSERDGGIGPVHYCSMSLRKAFSSRVLIPSSFALFNLEPESAPTTT